MLKVCSLLFCLGAALLSKTAAAQDDAAPVPQLSNDPRVEVITIIHYLSEDLHDPYFEKYYKQIPDSKFARYKNHTAVKYWKAIKQKHKLYPYEVSVNLRLENGLFRVMPQQENAFFTKLSDKERAEFVRLLNDFSHRSNLTEFCSKSVAYQ